MYKRKRLLSAMMATLLIGVSIIISDSVLPSKASAAESIIYYQGFETYPNNMIPSSTSTSSNFVPGFTSVQPRNATAGNSITIKSFVENGENKKALNLSAANHTTNGYNYLDTKVVDSQTANPLLFQGKVIFENRIRLDRTTGEFFIMGKNSTSANWLTFVKFLNGRILFLNTLDVGAYESNRWYRTTVIIDVAQMTADLQIDGKTIVSGAAITVTGVDFIGLTATDSWTFRNQNNNKNATYPLSVDIDFMKYYYPSQSLELVSSYPQDRQNLVPVSTSDIQLDFSNQLNPTTVPNIFVTDHNGTPVPTVMNSVYGSVYSESNGATVYRYMLHVTAEQLTDEAEYHVDLNGVQDLYGNTLNHMMKFTTRNRIIGEVSNDANLKNLKIDNVSVTGFVYSTNTYSKTLPFGTTTIPNVSAEASSVYAAVYTTQAQTLPGTSTIVVKAETGLENTYTINFLIEAPRTNNVLKSLKVNKDFLLRFLPGTNEYTYRVPYGTSAIPQVQAEVADSLSSLTLTPATALPGITTIRVTAQDGSVNTYSIHFQVEEPAIDAELSKLKVNDIEIQGFSQSKTEYLITLPYRTTLIPHVIAETSSKAATVSIIQAANAGDGEAMVTVTAQDGVTKQQYRIHFVEGKLSDLFQLYGHEMIYDNDSTLTAGVHVVNESNTTATATLALVLYGSDHSVKQVITEEKTLPFGQTTKLTTSESLSLPVNRNGYYVKLFIWDSLENMQLLGPVYTVSLQ